MASLAGAAEKETVPPERSLMHYANEMTVTVFRNGKEPITPEKLRDLASALFKYLEGEPKSWEKLVVHNWKESKYAKEDEVAVYAGYDNGLVSHGYMFCFQKKSGLLRSITVVPGE